MTTSDKLDKIIDELIEMKEIQIKHEANLLEHMRRTELLEIEVKPLVKNMNMVKGAGVLIGVIATLAAIYRSVG